MIYFETRVHGMIPSLIFPTEFAYNILCKNEIWHF